MPNHTSIELHLNARQSTLGHYAVKMKRDRAKAVAEKRNRARDAADAVKHAGKILAEAGKALNDRTRTIRQSDIPELLGAAAGVGAGVAAGMGILGIAAGDLAGGAAITAGLAGAGAIVGGGMMVGIGVVAAPAVVLGLGGYWAVNRIKKSKAREATEAALQEALRKRDAILSELRAENEANAERIEYLQQVLAQLQLLIEGLSGDLKATLPE